MDHTNKPRLFWSLIAGLAMSAAPADVAALVREAQSRYGSQDDPGALRLLGEARKLDPDHLEARWQEAYMILVVANRTGDRGERLRLCRMAMPKVDSLMALFPGSADAWFVGGLALGVEAGFADPRRRVELSKRLRHRIARCLAIDPRHPGGWFLLGRWHEGFATLNPVEKGMVDLLLGGMPPGTSLDSARIALERAGALRPSDLQIHLDLVRVLVRMGRDERARIVAERALGIPVVSAGDGVNRHEIARLLRRL
jgi:hypothetical protein